MEWKNYGDINFAEHGGTLIRKAFDDKECADAPLLDTIYDIFHVDREGDTLYAYLGSVDASDYDYPDLDASNKEDAELIVVQAVSEYGFGGCGGFGYDVQYPNSMSDLIIESDVLNKWLNDIGYQPESDFEKHMEEFNKILDSTYPTILPYVLENMPVLVVNSISDVPKHIYENKYMSYTHVSDDEKWYYDSSDDLKRLTANANQYDKTVIENPIYGMSEKMIDDIMYACMDNQDELWHIKYMEKAHNIYEQALKAENEGRSFILSSEAIKEIIEKHEGKEVDNKEVAKPKKNKSNDMERS